MPNEMPSWRLERCRCHYNFLLSRELVKSCPHPLILQCPALMAPSSEVLQRWEPSSEKKPGLSSLSQPASPHKQRSQETSVLPMKELDSAMNSACSQRIAPLSMCKEWKQKSQGRRCKAYTLMNEQGDCTMARWCLCTISMTYASHGSRDSVETATSLPPPLNHSSHFSPLASWVFKKKSNLRIH